MGDVVREAGRSGGWKRGGGGGTLHFLLSAAGEFLSRGVTCPGIGSLSLLVWKVDCRVTGECEKDQ